MNSGTQIKCLQTAPTGITIANVLRTSVRTFLYSPSVLPTPAESHLPAFYGFSRRREFPLASVTGIIFDNHNITREERCSAPLRFISILS